MALKTNTKFTLSHQRKKCIEKTQKMNVYSRRADAKRRQNNMRRKGKPVVAYKCGWCGNYHIGGVGNAEERLSRNQAQAYRKRFRTLVIFPLGGISPIRQIKVLELPPRHRARLERPKGLNMAFILVHGILLQIRIATP